MCFIRSRLLNSFSFVWTLCLLLTEKRLQQRCNKRQSGVLPHRRRRRKRRLWGGKSPGKEDESAFTLKATSDHKCLNFS